MNERHIYLHNIPLDEAQNRLMQAIQAVGKWQPLAGETIPLRAALGRVTAEPVWAKRSSPHYHAAAMDGYAVQAAVTYPATESHPLQLRLYSQAYPVNTGDLLPSSTNAVIMIEDVQHPDTETIEIRAAVAPRQHVRSMGEDMVATELVLPSNHILRPVDLGALAGCGYAEVSVRRHPQVVIIPTGSELVPPGQTPLDGQVIEYNSLVLQAQIQQAGGQAAITPIVPDDLEQLQTAVEGALAQSPDLILVLSGSSAGSRDHTANAIQALGELLVHGVAVRPGHPVIIGMIQTTPIIGVPGYPVSAALTGELFIQPLITYWLGILDEKGTRPRVTAILTRKLTSPTGDDDFVRVTLAQVGKRLLAAPLSRGAGVITSLVRADGLAHIPRFSEGVDMGQPVEVMLYRPLYLIQQTILAMGSHDPMLDLLGQFIANNYPQRRLTSANVGSMGGLVALRRQEAHLAGVHLLDPTTGNYNLPYIAQQLKNEALQVVTFAHREQGFIVAAGNPLAVQTWADLPNLRYVNRQRGAGTRVLLDYELQQRGIDPATINGYDHEEYTHLAVAAAVASGVADVGLGVRSAALSMELDFVSVGWERYDLVIPSAHLHHVEPLLAVLRDSAFQAALSAQPGYDTRETGQVILVK